MAISLLRRHAQVHPSAAQAQPTNQGGGSLSTEIERRMTARQLAEDIEGFSRPSTPTKARFIQVKPYDLSQAMEALTFKVQADISTLRYSISSNDAIEVDESTLEKLERAVSITNGHLDLVESIENEEDLPAEVRFQDPAAFEVCKKLNAIVAKNLSVIRDIQKSSPVVYIPKEFAHLAYLRASHPILEAPADSETPKTGRFGAVSLVRHESDPTSCYVIKQIRSDEDLISTLTTRHIEDLDSDQEEELKESLEKLKKDIQEALSEEIQTLFSIPDHEGLMRFYGLTEDGVPMLEALMNGELFDAVVDNKLNGDQQYAISERLAYALNRLHNPQPHIKKPPLIHCDMKLENVMLGNSLEDAKIVDFGLARQEFTEKYDRGVIGTFDYMAPEMLCPKNLHKNSKIDVWGYGCTVFAMLAETSFYDALYYSYYRKYPADTHSWTRSNLWAFLAKNNLTLNDKIIETIDRLERKNTSLSPAQKDKIFSALEASLVFDHRQRPSMEQIAHIFKAN